MSLMSVRETGDSGSTLPNGGAQCQITTQNLQDVTAQGVKPGMDHSAGLVWGRELPPGQMGTMGGGWHLMPEEQQHGLWKGLEVVIPVYLGPVHHGDLSEHLQCTRGFGSRAEIRATPQLMSHVLLPFPACLLPTFTLTFPRPDRSPTPFTSDHIRSEAK